jgi:predicted  nucleic acid-binding Zn-ribbon protein
MDTQTIDQEYAKLEGEFEDVAKTVQGLAEKMQAAEKAGDANATEWLTDLKQIVQDISDEQTQAKVLLLAIHSFIKNAATEPADEKPPLLAPGTQLNEEPQQQQQPMYQRRGMFGGGMMGGGMMGGYMGGGFAQAMEMGAGMSLGASLINSIFR